MTRNCVLLLTIICLACKTGPDGAASQKQPFKLTAASIAPGTYRYNITNETEIDIEAEGKDVNTATTSTITVDYTIGKDSANNLFVGVLFQKIKLLTKSGDAETELDADRASNTYNPVEKMLGDVKSAKLTAVLSPKGETLRVKGYNELGEKIVSGFDPKDTYGKAMARQQWDQLVGNQMVSGNLDQLFKIFPDSVVHVGDRWTLTARHQAQVVLNVTSTYTLETIEGDVAVISVKSTTSSDKAASTQTGYNAVADLQGTQEGEYKVNLKTGMPTSSTMEAETKGTMQVMGREVPMKIKNKVAMVLGSGNR